MSYADILVALKQMLYAKKVLSSLPLPNSDDRTIKPKAWSEPHLPWPSIQYHVRFEHGGAIVETVTVSARLALLLDGDCDGCGVATSVDVPIVATAEQMRDAVIDGWRREIARPST